MGQAVPIIATTSAAVVLATAAQAAPLQYLSGASDKASPVVSLTWGVLLISIAVMLIIATLLVAAIWRRPARKWIQGEKAEVLPDKGGLNWIWIGAVLSTLALLFTVIWTIKVLADIGAPPSRPTVTLEVTGRQWWWQVRYLSGNVSRQFLTANEIHIPVGQPIRLKLIGGDVIHSFWVPQLAGKMDAIPGQTNETWIEASTSGIYKGQCTEYCGIQHARMALVVIAEPPAEFQAWWKHQLAAPNTPQGIASTGQQDFQTHCANCHTVRGTEAEGALGPDLSHLMQRTTIASGVLTNDGPTLARWISDPQSLKPGSMMPAPSLSQTELTDIHAYLKTLD